MSIDPKPGSNAHVAGSTETIGAETGGRTTTKVPETGYWKPSCGAPAKHFKKGEFFTVHCSGDLWTRD